VINYIALIILIVAALADLLIPVILGFKYTGYDHFRDTISTLGTKESPVKKQESINLIIVGILFLVFALGQRFAFKNVGWSHNLYICGIIAFGIGCILAGIFPEDSKGFRESVSGKIHGIASGIGFIFLILNPLWATFIDAFEKYQALNIFLFGAGIITFALFMLSEKRETGFLKYTGLFQRLNLIALYGCLILNFTVMTTTGD
jgi:hypothetical protein